MRKASLKQLRHFHRRAVPIVRILRHQLLHDHAQRGWNIRIDFANGSRLFVGDATQNGVAVVGSKWWVARAEEIQHAAEAEQIRPNIHALPPRVLVRSACRVAESPSVPGDRHRELAFAASCRGDIESPGTARSSMNHWPIQVQKISPCLTIRRVFDSLNQAFTGFRNMCHLVSSIDSH